MAAVRKNGNVWEIAAVALGAIISASIILGGFISITAAGVLAKQKLQDATPRSRHDSLVAAVAKLQDTTVADVAKEVRSMRRDIMGFNCQRTGYPSPFCDSIPRVGEARRSP